MASRTESRALAAIEELYKKYPEIAQKGGIVFLQLDLTSLESCQAAARAFLEKEQRLDILSKPFVFHGRIPANHSNSQQRWNNGGAT